MTADCRLTGILAGEAARRVASKTHWRLILPTPYPSWRSDWPIHVEAGQAKVSIAPEENPISMSLTDLSQDGGMNRQEAEALS
jgi:hypothetical protein